MYVPEPFLPVLFTTVITKFKYLSPSTKVQNKRLLISMKAKLNALERLDTAMLP